MTQAMSIKIGTKDKLLQVLRMEGKEQLGALPEWQVELVGNVSLTGAREPVNVHTDLLGKRAIVTMAHGAERHFNGYITEAQRGERRGRFDAYRITMRPGIWFATRTRNSRVFQGETLEDIVKEVLQPYSDEIDWRLNGSPPGPYEYCVQYQESDFDFVSRLLEAEGLHYFFEHTDTIHRMVITESTHKVKKGEKGIKWANKFDANAASMVDWELTEEVHAVKAVVRDFDYLASSAPIDASMSASLDTTMLGDGEVFEYPAGVVQNQATDEAQAADKAMDRIAQVRMEELQSLQRVYTGTTNCNDLTVGATFDFEDAPHASDEDSYLVVSMSFSAEFADHEAIEEAAPSQGRRDGFMASVMCIKAGTAFRPKRNTPRPVMYGPQTALVVGASENEVQTDKHGRIKVQFHWDRKGKKNANSSCFVRLSQPWAGNGMGLWMIPRVGHEVVVSFLGGDPDRPLITGSVHNDVNLPIYPLPANADISGWRTHSTKDGATDARHELRFDDKKDSEYVWLQSQKNFHRHVKEDAFDWIEKNENKKVKLTRKEVVGENWYVNVGKDVMHDLGKDLHTKVAGDIFTTGAATWQVKLEKDYSAKIGADYGLDVTGKTAVKAGGDLNLQSGGAGNFKTTANLVAEAGAKLSLKATSDLVMEGVNVKAKGSAEIVLEATAGIKIVCGASVITLGPAGVTIDGPLVKVNCGGGGGSAGAAESAAAAEPKAPEEAKVNEDVAPDKAEDYDKLFADPLKDNAGAAGPASASVPKTPKVPEAPDVILPEPSDALGSALRASAAALLAAGGAAAMGLAQGTSLNMRHDDEHHGDDGEAARQKVLAESDRHQHEADANEQAADSIRDHRTAAQTLVAAQALYETAKAAEAAAVSELDHKTAAETLALAEAAYEAAKRAEEAAQAGGPDAEQALAEAEAAYDAAKQAEAAAQGPTHTADEVLAESDAAYNAAKQAEAQAAADAAAAAAPDAPAADGGAD